MMKNFDVYYSNDKNFRDFIVGGGLLDLDDLEKTHTKVYNSNDESFFEIYNAYYYESDKGLCEDIYHFFNDNPKNPLGKKVFQDKMKNNEINVRHTSMSVGDVIKINDKFYICKSIGWDLIERNK
jgi:hypothetical protein